MANAKLFREIKERLKIKIPEHREKEFYTRAYHNKIRRIIRSG